MMIFEIIQKNALNFLIGLVLFLVGFLAIFQKAGGLLVRVRTK